MIVTTRALLATVLLASLGVALHAQSPALQKKPPSVKAATYDTPAQTQAKIDTLFGWSIEHSAAGSPAASRPEYALQVLEILQHIHVPRITVEMYERLSIHDYLDDTGDFLATAWLNFGQLPSELSQTSIGGVDVVVYQWKNSDGGNVIATFRNRQVVSKAQSGLPRAEPGDWNPEVSEAALIQIRAKRGFKIDPAK